MSAEHFAIIPEAVLYDRTISANAVRVFGVLDRHADDDGECWPGQNRIGSSIGLSSASVWRAVKELREAGHVVVERRGRTLSNAYRVTRHQRESLGGDSSPAREKPRAGAESDSSSASANESQRNESHGTRDPLASSDALPGLEPKPKRPAKAGRRDAARVLAEQVVNNWWERQHPKPQQPWIATVKIVAKALRDGHTEIDMAAFLDETQVVSGSALDRWHRARRNGAGRQQPTAEGAMRAVRRAMGAGS